MYMYQIILSRIAIAIFVGTLVYVMVSEPKSKPENSTLFNASVTWGGSDEEEVFKTYKKSKVTFLPNNKET